MLIIGIVSGVEGIVLTRRKAVWRQRAAFGAVWRRRSTSSLSPCAFIDCQLTERQIREGVLKQMETTEVVSIYV